MLSRVLDYLRARPEVDKSRIAMHGVSWGAYWATKMAMNERARLKGVSVQSPPTDLFFQKEFVRNSLLGHREYLFDQIPAIMAIFDHVTAIDQLEDELGQMSLVNQHLLGKPTTSMLVIAGARDTQVLISDIYKLLDSGDVPKYAWINPQGGHLGRQAGVWPDPRIFKEVLVPGWPGPLTRSPGRTNANSLELIDLEPITRTVLGILLDSILTVWLQSGVVQKIDFVAFHF